MIINDFEIYSFSIPFKNELIFNTAHQRRSGFIVVLKNEKEQIACGEVSPFPGLHRESAEQALEQLMTVQKRLRGKPFHLHEKNIYSIIPDSSLFPSVQFGLEQVFYQFLAADQNQSIPEILFQSHSDVINVNGLIVGREKDDLENVRQLLDDGYETIKVKTGQNSLPVEIARIKSICAIAKGKAKLRLDANRQWTLEQALDFCEKIDKANIEYIEEPVARPELLKIFAEKTGMPVAIDESLPFFLESGFPDFIHAVIFKPAVLGGIHKTCDVWEKARSSGIKCIISSDFQTGVGLTLLSQLACGIGEKGTAAGLDTYKYLAFDVLEKPFCAKNGKIRLDELDLKLNMNWLRRIGT